MRRARSCAASRATGSAILTDGIGSLDASSTSVDHAVAINPLTADRIEVLRGPAALLFGSSAIGGVVNVIDARIPRRVPDEAVHVEGILDLRLGRRRALGQCRDRRAARRQFRRPFRRQLQPERRSRDRRLHPRPARCAPRPRPAPIRTIAALAELRGAASQQRRRGPGTSPPAPPGSTATTMSASRSTATTASTASRSASRSIRRSRRRRRVSTSRQTRADARAEIDTGGGFVEFGPASAAAIPTIAISRSRTRGDIAHHLPQRGLGRPARSAPVDPERLGRRLRRAIFPARLRGRSARRSSCRRTGPGRSACSRCRRSIAARSRPRRACATSIASLRADADADLGNPALRRSFDAFSGSLGASYAFAPDWRIGLNATRSERAPSAEELFANGPHAGTQAFEIGDPDLDTEKSWGLEATLAPHRRRLHLRRLDLPQLVRRLYLRGADRRRSQDDLPVFQYFQADARYFGVELEGSAHVAEIGAGR